MSELSTQNQFEFFGYQFSESESRVITACASKSVKAVPEYDLLKVVGVAIVKAVRTIGQTNKSDEDIKFITSGVFDYITRQRPNLRVDELILAIDMGSLGEFGEDVVFVSVKNVIQWIKAYASHKICTMTLLSSQKEKHDAEQALNESVRKQQDYWKDFHKSLKAEFDQYKDTGELTSVAWIYCKNLEEIGFDDFLHLDDERKQDIYDEEKANAIREKRESLINSHIVWSAKMLSEEALKSDIVKRCKNKCLSIWFDSLDSLDFERIEFLIKNKQ